MRNVSDTPTAPSFLASVVNADEALMALSAGATIIDAKNPSLGALGALPLSVLSDIVTAVAGRAPVSATIGDLPSDGSIMARAVVATAATGVDIVKCGFFGDGDARRAIDHLGRQDIGAAKLVAVMMADRAPDFSLVADLAAAGFMGVMIDTADKTSGSLVELMAADKIAAFVAAARHAGLMVGLAGSLRHRDLATLVPFKPDVIGFRGALVEAGSGRTGRLDASNVAAIAAEFSRLTHPALPSERHVA